MEVRMKGSILPSGVSILKTEKVSAHVRPKGLVTDCFRFNE